MAFAPEGSQYGPRSAPRRLPPRMTSPGRGFPPSRLPGFLRSGALPRRRKLDAGAAGLGKPDRDGLLGGSGAVLPFPHVVDLFPNEFTRLGRGGLPLALVPLRSFPSGSFRHAVLPPSDLDPPGAVPRSSHEKESGRSPTSAWRPPGNQSQVQFRIPGTTAGRYTTLRPWMTRTSTTMIATTSSR